VFESLKAVLTSMPVLQLPDFSQPFVVDCDASGSGIGAVLHQGQGLISLVGRWHHTMPSWRHMKDN
jgi:hypothetical protein